MAGQLSEAFEFVLSDFRVTEVENYNAPADAGSSRGEALRDTDALFREAFEVPLDHGGG